MYEIAVHAEFCAAHALLIRGEREPVHGHNWHVTAVLGGPALDGDGLLCDFHAVQRILGEIIAPMHNHDLNGLPAFATVNPSAECVARHIADELAARLAGEAPQARVLRVSVTEAPGCLATYRREEA